MLRRVLTIVDGSESCKAAREYAYKLVNGSGAKISGLAVLDTPWITAAQAEPLGGVAYKLYRDESIIEETQEEIDKILKEFKTEAKKAGIDADAIEADGFPASEIESIANEHDIVIIGKTTDFHFQLEEDSDIIVKNVIHDNPRPVIVVPKDHPKGSLDQEKTILIAYDGTFESSKALHMFLLLDFCPNKKVHIVTINESKEDAEDIIKQAYNLCKAYGIKATKHCIESSKSPYKIILDKIDEIGADLLVMGTHNRGALAEVLFGSNTSKLIKKSNIPLFIHH